MTNMGLDFGLESSTTCEKVKFRWLLKIPSISASGVNSLPPLKSARPSLSFKEIQVEHLNETIYFPGKPDWKPLTLTLYDLQRNTNPIFSWLQLIYNPCTGVMQTPVDNNFIKQVELDLYDGCGNSIETWIYDNCWPQSVEFGELDMASNEVITCDLTIRYARAYAWNNCFS